MPPWIEEFIMEQQQHRPRRSTRHPTRSSSNSWSVRSVVMYSASGASGSDSVRSNSSSLSPIVAVSSTPAGSSSRLRWFLGLVTLLAVLSGSAEAVCDPDRWWNLEREECDPCTVCGEQQLVLRPCQEYMDTVCGTIGDLDMDLAQLARTEARHEQRHWKEERRKDGSDGHQHRPLHQHHGPGNGQHPGGHPGGSARKHENTEEILWDWQAASLLLAIIGCLMFFFAAAIIALNQTRQWKRIEKHFDADMEALSAQLMNHLSSMQQLEDGSIFLDDVLTGGGDQRRFHRGGGERNSDSMSSTSALLGGGGHHHHHHHHPIEVRCVYLDQLLDSKNCIQSQGPGNLYIEETNNNSPSANNVDRVQAPPACHLPSANGTNGASPLNRVRLY